MNQAVFLAHGKEDLLAHGISAGLLICLSEHAAHTILCDVWVKLLDHRQEFLIAHHT